jgi:hypothetical protein
MRLTAPLRKAHKCQTRLYRHNRGANALAYLSVSSETKKKKFNKKRTSLTTRQARHGVDLIKLFTAVTYGFAK